MRTPYSTVSRALSGTTGLSPVPHRRDAVHLANPPSEHPLEHPARLADILHMEKSSGGTGIFPFRPDRNGPSTRYFAAFSRRNRKSTDASLIKEYGHA